MKKLNFLLTEEDKFVSKDLLYPLNLFVIDTLLKKKLAQDPDGEYWVDLVYYKYAKFGTPGRMPLVPTQGYYISNKGRVARYKSGKYVIVKTFKPKKEYIQFSISLNGKQKPLILHRALACSFIPTYPKLMMHPKDLQANHINGRKFDYALGNLEWTTQKGNIDHAIETGLKKYKVGITNHRTQPVKGTFLFGPNKGYQFVLFGDTDVVKNGFAPARVISTKLGRIKHTSGCHFCLATEEDIKVLPNGVGSLPLPLKKVLVCINITTKESFEIEHSMESIKEFGLSPKAVWRVLKGQRPHHKGYTFETY